MDSATTYMKKHLIFFAIIISAITLTSCGNGKTPDSKELDTVWNEKVQDTFYGATFGDSIATAVEQIESHGFWLNRSVSMEDFVSFRPKERMMFSFGGLGWKYLYITAVNGKFNHIEFMLPFSDKAAAMDEYNSVLNTVSQKYKITPVEITDTNTYAKCRIFGKNETAAYIVCDRYESVGNEIWFGCSLVYGTLKDFGTNNEL